MGAAASKNAFRQNHAQNFAQDRGNDYAELGDTSTLTDPGVVTDLVKNRQNR